ncbi:cation diffusion facilitator family transporter, partial [Eubacterium aggregans]|uniref:cation diffusion facilitator family transporter n=1 Tax=Eubacterium aggregans TaxID=81409 RepID=UPI003F300456
CLASPLRCPILHWVLGGDCRGYPILDPLAAVVIALMVIKVAFDIGKDSINKMLDTSVDKETEAEIRQLVATSPKVEGIDDLRTRTFGSSFYVDLEIAMDGAMSLQAAHSIADEIHDALEEK